MTSLQYLAVALSLCCMGCDRTTLPSGPIGVPSDANLLVSAPSLSALRQMATLLEPLDVAADRGDEDQPAWFACAPDVCLLRRAATADLKQRDDRWNVPDGDGSLVVWGAPDKEALRAAMTHWATGVAPSAGWTGFIEPRTVLERWKPTNPRAKELVERATFQAGRIDFTMKTRETTLDAQLRMQPVPGEPVFVDDLGAPRGDAPSVAGLTDAGMLGMVRLSADPHKIWALLRSVLAADQRQALDDLLDALASQAALDVEKQVIDGLSGHVFVIAYGLSDLKNPTLADWLTLGATSEAVLIGVRDRTAIRRALDAWTQLSEGRLQVQSTGPDKQEWAWFEDDEIRWTAMLGRDYVLVVDSSVALDHARSWEHTPVALADVLKSRGVDELLEGPRRSGIYVDVAALRTIVGDAVDDVIPGLQAIRASARPDADGREVVDVRLTLER